MNELMRASRFLETHFCENLGFRFFYKGQEVPPMSVFHQGFMLGIASHVVDLSGLNTGDAPLVKRVTPSEDGFFKCRFDLDGLNGFRLVQVISVLEMFFGISQQSTYERVERDFELSELIESLFKNYVSQKE